MVAQILCIGQSDSCAGTGIQADIKTAQAFKVYTSTVVTAVSVQNTLGVFDTHMIPPILVRSQIEKVIEDLKPTVIKMGMLANIDTINMLGDMLDEEKHHDIQVVIDPVMTNRAGTMLLDKDARDAFKRRLLIHADVLTPNIQEAFYLSGYEVKDIDEMCHAADTLRTLGVTTVILKGGGIATDVVPDVLSDEHGAEVYNHDKMETRATHGAGTTLSAGIASCLALGMDHRAAYAKARAFVTKAIKNAEQIGYGFGPLNHTVEPDDV